MMLVPKRDLIATGVNKSHYDRVTALDFIFQTLTYFYCKSAIH